MIGSYETGISGRIKVLTAMVVAPCSLWKSTDIGGEYVASIFRDRRIS
jgi:hypothetical protein